MNEKGVMYFYDNILVQLERATLDSVCTGHAWVPE